VKSFYGSRLRFTTTGDSPDRNSPLTALHTIVSACTSRWATGRGRTSAGFTTTLAQVGIDGTERRDELGVLYAACGLGAAGAAREGAGTLYVIRKRIGQHALALRSSRTLMTATPMLCSDAAAAAHHGQPPEMTPCRDQVPRPCTDS